MQRASVMIQMVIERVNLKGEDPVNKQSRLFLHARRTRQRTSPSTDRTAKRSWFNEARSFNPHFFFPVIYITCIQL